MGVVCGGLGGRRLEINKIKSKNPKIYLGFIIICMDPRRVLVKVTFARA